MAGAAGLRASTGAGLAFMAGGGGSTASGGGAVAAAYGPAAGSSVPSILNPGHGHGAGFYLRIGLILVALHMYYSAPR